MGKKQLKSLLIVLVVVGVLAVVLNRMQSGKVQESISVTDRENLIADFPINDVAEVKIEGQEGAVTLKRGEEGWAVAERDGYPAKGDRLVELLRMIWGLKIVQNVEVGKSQYARLHLADPGEGSEKKEGQVEKMVHFKGKDGKILKTLYIGKAHEREENRPNPFGGAGPSMTEVGRYVRIADEDGVVLVSETFRDADTKAANWLSEKFIQVQNIKSIEIQTGKKEDDWKLTREKPDGDFVLVDAKKDEEFDPTRASAMKTAFASPRFDDVVTGDEAEKKPDKTTFLIDTFAGFHYVVKAGEKNDLNEYQITVDVSAKLDDKREPVEGESEEDKKKNDEEFAKAVKAQKDKLAFEQSFAGKVFKIRSYAIDSIKKKRSELMKQEEVKPGEAPGGIPGGLPGGIPGLPGAGGPGGLPQGIKLPGGHPPVQGGAAVAPKKASAPKGEEKKETEKSDQPDKDADKAAAKPAVKPKNEKSDKDKGGKGTEDSPNGKEADSGSKQN